MGRDIQTHPTSTLLLHWEDILNLYSRILTTRLTRFLLPTEPLCSHPTEELRESGVCRDSARCQGSILSAPRVEATPGLWPLAAALTVLGVLSGAAP